MKVSDVWLKNAKWLKKNYDTENLLTNYKKPMEVLLWTFPTAEHGVKNQSGCQTYRHFQSDFSSVLQLFSIFVNNFSIYSIVLWFCILFDFIINLT